MSKIIIPIKMIVNESVEGVLKRPQKMNLGKLSSTSDIIDYTLDMRWNISWFIPLRTVVN